mmetsp:Transcript_19523/g.13976  ORF Transcript_19523/g.13976 Transcript_19523/m.13976 type:complete len:142 (-) Transcript_19523:595-1020(-)
MDGGSKKGGAAKQAADEYKAKAESKKKAEQKALLASLFKGVTQVTKTEDGTEIDPKTLLCSYFKAGVCEKGKKCKFSHDLGLESKKANIDIYSDPRQGKTSMPDTIVTCRDFLSAVEKNLYGWQWVCPNNGENCPYRHMVP